MGWITNNEARMQLGFRGAAPGVTPELEEIFKVRSIQYSNDNGNQTDPTSQKTKVDEPKDRSGRDPEGSDSKKRSDAGETKRIRCDYGISLFTYQQRERKKIFR